MHIAATYDGQAIKIYVDGTEDGSLNTTFTISRKSSDLNIGATSTGNNKFEGQLDDIRVYRRGLTPAEIQMIKNGEDVN